MVSSFSITFIKDIFGQEQKKKKFQYNAFPNTKQACTSQIDNPS